MINIPQLAHIHKSSRANGLWFLSSYYFFFVSLRNKDEKKLTKFIFFETNSYDMIWINLDLNENLEYKAMMILSSTQYFFLHRFHFDFSISFSGFCGWKFSDWWADNKWNLRLVKKPCYVCPAREPSRAMWEKSVEEFSFAVTLNKLDDGNKRALITYCKRLSAIFCGHKNVICFVLFKCFEDKKGKNKTSKQKHFLRPKDSRQIVSIFASKSCQDEEKFTSMTDTIEDPNNKFNLYFDIFVACSHDLYIFHFGILV